MNRSVLFAIIALTLCIEGKAAEKSTERDWMPRSDDATQLWWVEGPPKVFSVATKPAEETLCFRFGERQLLFDTRRVRPVEGRWECAVVAEGRRYACQGHRNATDEFFQPVRFVENGRFFQRVTIEDLKFVDGEGKEFDGKARLEIVVWPDRLAFRLECDRDAGLELRFGERQVVGARAIVVEAAGSKSAANVESELPVTYDETLGCHRLSLPEKPWSNASGTYYPEEHLDRVDRWRVTLGNDSDAPTVARLLFSQQHHLPITGFTPLLCDADGAPTGLPVQVSKNWHQRPEKGHVPHEGPWFHGFAYVRIPARSRREFNFQMVYARYGGVCAASHAQLSLVGWGHNQFWDQAAIGSFGESICFEPGRVQRRCFITDVRPLMTLSRESSEKRWGWAENCGGGDFLMWIDSTGRYQSTKGTRVDYRSHGPLLTDVGYQEETVGGEITARMDVSVPAANDHLRTFLRLRYDVRKPVRWRRLAFFQLGADFYNDVPARQVAFGDVTGLRDEWKPRLAKDVYDRVTLPLVGELPWISIHDVDRKTLRKGSAAANRGLIVRSWRAVLGGKSAAPHLAAYCTEWGKENYRTSLELSPPADVVELLAGDFVEAELELVVFPADAPAYYGPDAKFREALTTAKNGWQLVHREAAGNSLSCTTQHGQLSRSYPVVVAVDEQQRATLELRGGLGHVPLTFTGLSRPTGYQLFADGQLLDHRQVDWNPLTKTWQATYLVPPNSKLDLK